MMLICGLVASSQGRNAYTHAGHGHHSSARSSSSSSSSSSGEINHLHPLPRLGLGETTSIGISGISSGADFAVYFSIAHSATVSGAGIFAGNVYRCYSTRFPGDDVVDCKELKRSSQNYSTAGCTNVDPHQAPCNTADASDTLPCPPGYGLPLSKCQGCAAGSSKYVRKLPSFLLLLPPSFL